VIPWAMLVQLAAHLERKESRYPSFLGSRYKILSYFQISLISLNLDAVEESYGLVEVIND
jgi:hypothetical protein